MKTAIPLNKFPSSSCPTKSPLWYCTDVCQYISSMIETLSPGTVCFSRSDLATFSKSTSPDVNFFKIPNEGSGSAFRKNYTFGMNCTVTLMKIVSKYWKIWTDHAVYNIKCSFKITLHSFPHCFIFDAKYSSLLNLATVKICPWQKHSVSGITCLS